MRAALLREVDGPFELVDLPDPEPDGKALVRVRGSEIAGELENGTRVMAITSGGGHAELAAVAPEQVVPLPERASFAEGASFLLTFLTAYIPLTRQARLAKGGDGARLRRRRRDGDDPGRARARRTGGRGRRLAREAVGVLRARCRGGPRLRRSPGGAPGRCRLRPGAARRPQLEPPRLLPRPAAAARPRRRRRRADGAARAVGRRCASPLVGARLPLEEVERGHELVETRQSVGTVVLDL